jgi:hypothetical protein
MEPLDAVLDTMRNVRTSFERLLRHVHGGREDPRNEIKVYIRPPRLAVSAVTNSVGTSVCSHMIVTAFAIKSIG